MTARIAFIGAGNMATALAGGLLAQGWPAGRIWLSDQHLPQLQAHAGRGCRTTADNAEVVLSLSKLPWAAFGEGTDKGDTRAKPEIWSQHAKFSEASDKMQAEVAKLAAAAKTGNLDNLKAAFGPAAGTCKACHDNFRKD